MYGEWIKTDIYCSKCHKYLFSEYDREGMLISHGNYKRENDKGNYIYDELKDEFICNDCRKENVK